MFLNESVFNWQPWLAGAFSFVSAFTVIIEISLPIAIFEGEDGVCESADTFGQ